MSDAVGITESRCRLPGDKLPPPSYYEALRYPLEADDRYSPVEYVDVQADDETDFYATFNQGNFKSLSQTELLNENTEHEGPSRRFKQVEHSTFSSPESTSTGIPKDVQNPNTDIGNENENTNLIATFDIYEGKDENLTNDALDLDIVQSSIKAADDTYEHLREPDVIQESSDVKSDNGYKDSYDGLSMLQCFFERSENDEENLTEVSRDFSEVPLRKQASFKGFSSGCRPISGITTRSFSPEPGPSGYTGAKNKGLKKTAAVTYDSRNGSYRTLPTSSSENVNSVQEMALRFDTEIDKQALRTGEAADRGTIYCACGILFCIVGMVLILVYIV